jgi:hypothetical protein
MTAIRDALRTAARIDGPPMRGAQAGAAGRAARRGRGG